MGISSQHSSTSKVEAFAVRAFHKDFPVIDKGECEIARTRENIRISSTAGK